MPPRISIITPNLNSAKYIEEAIRSVIHQKYNNLEYIVVDGGSTDNSLKIIEKYRASIGVIISESDQGTYHAIQKGIKHSTGEIIAWLNSNDMYHTNALATVGRIFEQFPEVDWITGLPTFWNRNSECINVYGAASAYPNRFIRNGWFNNNICGYLQQESMFWRRSLWDKAGGFDLSLKFAGDFDLWTRFARHADLVCVAAPLAGFRSLPGEQRSSVYRDAYEQEVQRVCANLPAPPFIWNAISKRGLLYRSFCRLLIWKKSKVIAYSIKNQDWFLKEISRPLSRASLSDLMLEANLRNFDIFKPTS